MKEIFDAAKEDTSAYGIYIIIDDSTLRMIDEMRACAARKKVDVCVRYGNEDKDFELDTFLSLLGFKQ